MASSAKTLLERLPQTRGWSRHQIRRTLVLLEPRNLAANETLFEQGSDPDGMALVLSGSLLVTATMPDGELIPLGRVGAGGVVGEMGVIDHAPRTATVTCKQPGLLLVLDRRGFERMVAHKDPLLPSIMDLAARGLAERICLMTGRIAAAAIDPERLRQLPSKQGGHARRWWVWLDKGRR